MVRIECSLFRRSKPWLCATTLHICRHPCISTTGWLKRFYKKTARFSLDCRQSRPWRCEVFQAHTHTRTTTDLRLALEANKLQTRVARSKAQEVDSSNTELATELWNSETTAKAGMEHSKFKPHWLNAQKEQPLSASVSQDFKVIEKSLNDIMLKECYLYILYT